MSKKEKAEKKKTESELIEETGSISLDGNRQKHNIELITIIGEVEGHENLSGSSKTTKYEHLLPKLAQLEDAEDVDGVLILLNTMGGDVEAGLAIAEMVASMTKPTVSLVLGGGHSIGVPLAVSADVSFIVPSATMTIHPVRMSGTIVGVPQTYYYFQRMQDRIIRFITDHSGVREEDFRKMLMKTDEIATDTGSLIDGYQAVQCGLIDKTGGLSEALGELRERICASKPKQDPAGEKNST